jgi:hypothetical protein
MVGGVSCSRIRPLAAEKQIEWGTRKVLHAVRWSVHIRGPIGFDSSESAGEASGRDRAFGAFRTTYGKQGELLSLATKDSHMRPGCSISSSARSLVLHV